MIQDGKKVVVLKVWRADQGRKDKHKGGRNKSRKVGLLSLTYSNLLTREPTNALSY